MSETQSLEVIPPSALEALQRGEIDSQIATAHRFPRSMAEFKKRALAMATIDEETAASCLYSKPVGKDPDSGEQKYAEGLSVRAAEICAASYGNLRVSATIIDQTPRRVVCRGMAIDLEANYAVSSETSEPTIYKNGNPYTEGHRNTIAKATLAKARRDATFQVVPRALFRSIEKACRSMAVGDATTLAKRTTAALSWLALVGVSPERVFAAMGVKAESEITLSHLALLTGIRTALIDKDTTPDEAFPPVASGNTTLAAALTPASQSATVATPPPAASPLAPPAEASGAPTPPRFPQGARVAFRDMVTECGIPDQFISGALVKLKLITTGGKLTEEKAEKAIDNFPLIAETAKAIADAPTE